MAKTDGFETLTFLTVVDTFKQTPVVLDQVLSVVAHPERSLARLPGSPSVNSLPPLELFRRMTVALGIPKVQRHHTQPVVNFGPFRSFVSNLMKDPCSHLTTSVFTRE